MSTSPFRLLTLPLNGSIGTVYGKIWGPPNGKRVLGVHGWMDNAGTFDRLAPLLPKDVQFVAVDLPGHGLSYHKSRTYHMVDYIQDVKRIVDALGWSKFTYVGHSNGACIGALFAGTFPEMVDRLLMIDGLAPFPSVAEKAAQYARDGILSADTLIGKKAKVYASFDEAVAKTMENNKTMSLDGARCLAARGITQFPDGTAAFAHDPWLRATSLQRLSESQFHSFLREIKCPATLMIANSGWPFPKEYFYKCVDVLKESSPEFELIKADGDHHIHLTNPTAIADHVSKFLEKASFGEAQPIQSSI